MGLIKVEWEIGKNKFDKYVLYYFWLAVKFVSFYPKVLRKESQIPVPKILQANLIKIAKILGVLFFVLVGALISYLQLNFNDGPSIVILLVLSGIVALITIYVCICTVYYAFRFAFRLLEALVDTILIFRNVIKETRIR